MLFVKLGTHLRKMVFEGLCGFMTGFLFQVAPFVWQHIGERNDEEGTWTFFRAGSPWK